MRIFYRVLRIVLYSFFSLFTPKKNIILIQYDKNDSYGNISILYEKMKGAPDVYKICGTSQNIIEEVKNIYLVAGSRVIAVDTSSPYVSQIQHSSKTDIIFIGHGGGAYKKMAFAALSPDASRKERQRVQRVHGKYTYVISSSSSICHQVSYNYNIDISHVKSLGLPRTDVFYNTDFSKYKEIFLIENPSISGKKLILYAPTFRTQKKCRHAPLFIDESVFPKNFYDEFCILFRKHPTAPEISFPSSWIDVSNYSLLKCLTITDFLISDFSSIIFDFSFFHKPIFLLIPDLKQYIKKERTLWFLPSEIAPGMCCRTTEDIIEKLKNPRRSDLWEKYMDKCDGSSSERIINFIFQLKNMEH